MKNKKYNMTDLNNVMESLLAENGCPWDKVQTHETLKNYLIEESYEVVEAIDNKDSENLCEELGDVLFQIIFHSKLAERENKFDFSDVVNNVTAKMIYRHPHVFADESADTPQDVSKSWEVLKKKEKGYNTKKDVLESIPNALPALIKGDKTVSKATKLGLENINLTINSGETVGILGETGAGKSTLVNLIPRLYDTTEGDIFIDGQNVKNISLDYLRSSIGTVLQKTILFSGTIKNNIKWGDSNASDEEIIECAKDAQAYDFIINTDNGFDTELGQMGVNVSGGQKQRISIARTLLKKSKILIFDDSTSALDTGTEAKIQSVLKNKYKDVTKIIIAQKITSVMNSDKIILIHGGKIIGEGTHDYLMANSKEYREIYESQIREEDELNGR